MTFTHRVPISNRFCCRCSVVSADWKPNEALWTLLLLISGCGSGRLVCTYVEDSTVLQRVLRFGTTKYVIVHRFIFENVISGREIG